MSAMRQLAIRYSLRLADGVEVENNHWEEPLVYTEGSGELLPALDRALRGLAVGETRRVELSPTQAYGPRDEELVQQVSLFELPPEARVEGAVLSVGDEAESFRQARVARIDGEHALLDLNHPLAGEALVFDVVVVDASR